jgi:hypothetical protein
MAANCECNFIGSKAGDGFVAVEFLLPSEAAVAAASAAIMTSSSTTSSCYEQQKQQQQQQQQMCVLCHRRLVQSLFYDIIYSGKFFMLLTFYKTEKQSKNKFENAKHKFGCTCRFPLQGRHPAVRQHLQPGERIRQRSLPDMSSEWTCRMHATPQRVPSEKQVLCCTEKWRQVCPAALCGGAGFSASPSIMMMTGTIVGSTQTIIHPIVQLKKQQQQLQNQQAVAAADSVAEMMGGGGGICGHNNDDNDGGADASSSSRLESAATNGKRIKKRTDSKVPENYYCPSNPCINKRIHELHMDMLAGEPDAEMQMNRYLLLCAVLLRSTSSDSELFCRQKGSELAPTAVEAAIAWKCDLCPDAAEQQDQACLCKSVRMLKGSYKLQFRSWKLPGFCGSSLSSSSLMTQSSYASPWRQSNQQQKQQMQRPKARKKQKTGDAERINGGSNVNRRKMMDLELPLVQCLKTSLEDTPCYHALPDLGMYIRGILQRRYYTEAIRKHWVKACASSSSSTSPPSSSSAHHAKQQQQQGHNAASSDHQYHTQQDARTKAQWKYMHGVCANLLLESIPCMKRTKRCCTTPSSAGAGAGNDIQQTNSTNDTVEVMACINVMHGTLLKLYPLGAKTPTFNARVHLFSR